MNTEFLNPVDPFANPRLCPTDADRKKINGARFGCSREAGTQWHGGTDLEAAEGTALKAIHDGKVTLVRDLKPTDADYKKGLGSIIIVRSADFSMKYCHLSRIDVKNDQEVKAGATLGATGKSGNAYNVPNKHLHVEVSTDHFATNTKYVDPEPYLKTRYQSDGSLAGTGDVPRNPNDPNADSCPGFLKDEMDEIILGLSEDIVDPQFRVLTAHKCLLEVGDDNWLMVRKESSNQVISISKYCRVENNSFIGTGASRRERFRILDWPNRGEYVTVQALTDDRSRLGNAEFNVGAEIVFDKSARQISVNGGVYVANARFAEGTALSNGEYLLSCADAPHAFGRPYLPVTSFALTWFFINDSDTLNRYLHVGGASEGCLTTGIDVPNDRSKWTDIARFLLTQRLTSNNNFVGTIIVKD